MGPSRHFRLGIPLAIVAYALSSPACVDFCPNHPDAIGLAGPAAADYGVAWWPGDKTDVTATAVTLNEFCSNQTLYSSTSSPDRFTFVSSDPTVASVSSTGSIAMLAVGTTTVTATAEGVSGGYPIRIIPAVSQLEMTVVPASPRYGDTVTVTVTATGPDGQPVASPGMSSLAWRGVNGGTSGVWLDGANMTMNRFVVTYSGNLVVTATALHTIHGTPTVTKVITLAP